MSEVDRDAEIIAELQGRVTKIKQQVDDLQSLYDWQNYTPEQQVALQTELMAVEERLLQYWAELKPNPAPFWQAVRFGGLGLLLGALIQRLWG